MPVRARSSDADGSGTTRKRYAAAVEKGESAWRREWGGFISGLTLKRLRDGNTVAVIKRSANLEEQQQQRQKAQKDEHDTSGDDNDDDTSGSDDDSDAMSPAATFAYLFSSPAERKAARKQQQEQQQARKQQQQQQQQLSRHQQAVLDAERRGLQLASMTRKQKREFLRLTRNAAEEQAAAQHARSRKLHELMDARIAWYQQGPHPVDLIAEKLVTRKAEKKGRQLQLRYNYLLPHPSWLARRAQRRREDVHAGLGRRFVFDDDGCAYDALHHRPVDLAHASLLLHEPLQPPSPSPGAAATAGAVEDDDDGDAAADRDDDAAATTASRAPPHTAVLADPRRVRGTLVRAVAASRAAAVAIQQANLSTHFLSSHLVRADDAAALSHHA